MFINELEKPVTTAIVGKVLKEIFDFELSELTIPKAHVIYEDICGQITEFRNNDQYFLSERNETYLGMLATAKFLDAYLQENILIENTDGLTAGKAIAKAKEAKEQSADFLAHILKKIAEAYLVNVARVWIAKRPNNTLMVDFGMGGVGFHINGKSKSNREINASRWWTSVDNTLREICGELFDLATPRTMEVKNGVITFKSQDTRRSVNKPIREENLLEAPKKPLKAKTPDAQAAMYHHGIKKGAGHAVDTTRKFIPHVAGSALGAFTAGLKGQALQSEHGRVKIANLEQELEMINPENPASVNKFFGKQMQEHFSEYKDPNSRRGISEYMNKIYRDGLAGKLVTAKDVEAALPQIKGNPFRNVTDPKLRKELVEYFMNIYNGAKTSKNQKQIATRTTAAHGQASTQTMTDVVSALQNLGYPRKNAIDAVKQAVEKTPDLKGNFEHLLKGAQALVRK